MTQRLAERDPAMVEPLDRHGDGGGESMTGWGSSGGVSGGRLTRWQTPVKQIDRWPLRPAPTGSGCHRSRLWWRGLTRWLKRARDANPVRGAPGEGSMPACRES
jgi:hypothetical protein